MALSADPRIGTRLLGYEIEAILGRGGMGDVYKAYDPRLKRYIALKLLPPGLAEDTGFRERFLRESELAASLDHPSIVPIYDAGEVGGQLYIAMRYVEGTDLKALIREDGALAPAHAFALLAQLADALDTAHERGLVHRDVKPSNALLDAAGHLYLADFGLTQSTSDRSELTAAGQIVGTVDYVAPEQIEGEEIDGRADLYSLGCLLYECLTGEVPFPRDTELAVLWAHLYEPPPRPSERNPALSRAVDTVLAKAMAKSPDERHASCAELVEEAREALGLREIVLVRDRRPLLMVSAGLLLAVSAAIAAFLVSQGGGGPAKPSTKPTLALTADALQRIDPKTNKLVATLRLGSDPTGVAVGEDSIWTIHLDDNRISKVDPRSNEVVATSSAPGPQAVVAGARSVWVVNGDGATVTQLDQRSAAQIHVVSVPEKHPTRRIRLGSRLGGKSADGHRGAGQSAELQHERVELRRGTERSVEGGRGRRRRCVDLEQRHRGRPVPRASDRPGERESGRKDPAAPRRVGHRCRRWGRLGREPSGRHGVANRGIDEPRRAHDQGWEGSDRRRRRRGSGLGDELQGRDRLADRPEAGPGRRHG